MENSEDLIVALMEEGLEPTPEAVSKLDEDINKLAEILLDWQRFKMEAEETLKNARIGLIAELRRVIQIRVWIQ